MCSFKTFQHATIIVRYFRKERYLLEAQIRKNRLEKRTHPGLEHAWILVFGQRETGGTSDRILVG